MASKLVPKSTKAIVLRKCSPQRTPPYHDASLEERSIATLKSGELLVKISAAAFNHRDVWQRLGQYPSLGFGCVFGSDGAGTVVASADGNDTLLRKRVFLVPMRGWESHPDTPETEGVRILGGSTNPDIGTFAEHVVVDRSQVILAPDHLDDVQMAAWPLAGVTAWRAAIVNGLVKAGDNVLITGIGGGVALVAMQLCLAKKANVYVSSSSEDKIRRAVSLGAKGGVNYKSKKWPSDLAALLSTNGKKPLDCVIDSGGGDLLAQVGKHLKQGGRVVCYGMTASPQIRFTMRDVLKNQKILGSTMGSHKDLIDATKFMAEHRIVPVVSHVLDGLEAAEEGFELMRQGGQFGKIVIRLDGLQKAKL